MDCGSRLIVMGFVPYPVSGGPAVGAQYRRISLTSRVEGASRQQLVLILYDEAIVSIGMMMTAMQRGDVATLSNEFVRAISIVQELEAGLDFMRGGAVANSLGVIYRSVRQSLSDARASGDIAPARSARDLLRDIAEAWAGINSG